MKIFAAVIVMTILGGFVGYMLGVSFACLGPNAGNLCGLLGVFITGPLGMLAGGIGTIVVLARRRG